MAAKSRTVAVVYGASPGAGGLGLHAATVLDALGDGKLELHAFGPEAVSEWPLPKGVPKAVWHAPPVGVPKWKQRYTYLRWNHGRLMLKERVSLGKWAVGQIERLRPDLCYVFSEIGLETLHWARGVGVPTLLDSPTNHVQRFRSVRERESERLCSTKFRGHPSEAMVERVQAEYKLADRIRVASSVAKNSMIEAGLPAEKIEVINLPLNLNRFTPEGVGRPCVHGPLRLCYIGSLDLGKGFVYLLRALKLLGQDKVELEIVGATGDRCCRRIFERERVGLNVKCAPGDPLPAYHRAELLAMPSLDDGFGFVVAEAMACGLPVIVTDRCGAAELVRPGETGWIIPAGCVEAIAEALDQALQRREALQTMGRLAREDVERSLSALPRASLSTWIDSQF